MTRFLSLFTYLLLALGLHAQETGKFHVRYFTTDNGLPSNGIKGLQWDEQTGFLWIASEAGTIRFNGLEFRTYHRENLPNMGSERMLFMARNNSGQIFAVDQRLNMFKINKNNLEFWQKLPSQRKPYSFVVSENFVQPQTDSAIHFVVDPNRVVPLGDTACYAITRSQLYYLTAYTKTEVKLDSAEKVASCFKIKEHSFAITDRNRLLKLSPGPAAFIEIEMPVWLKQRTRSSLFWQNRMNNPVLIDQKDVWLLDYIDGKIERRMVSSGLPPDILIRYVQYSEKYKLLFVGTDSRGLIVVSPKRVSPAIKEDGVRDRNAYYVQFELNNGSILTGEGHVFGEYPGDSLPIRGKFGNSLLLAADSVLWFTEPNDKTGFFYISNYNYKTGKRTTFSHGMVHDQSAFAHTSMGLFFARGRGIGRVEGDSVRYLLRLNNDPLVFAMQEIEPGILVLATCQGLLRFDIKKQFLDTLFASNNHCVRSLWKYGDYLFFGTYGKGFFVYKNGTIRQMPLDINNYLLFSHCFLPDGRGYVWMSTNRGLFKAKISELTDAFEKKSSRVYYHYFGKDDGMRTTEMNGGCNPCAIQLRSGLLSFPTMEGLLIVDPDNDQALLPEGNILVDEVRIDDRNMPADSITILGLPAGAREVVFNLALSAWGNRENLYIDYQIDNGPWNKVLPQNGLSVRVVNLSAGKHVLRIRKLNGFGTNNYTVAQLEFSVARYWYREWWFYALLAAILAGLFILFSRFRTRRLQIRQLQLEQLIADKTRELQQKNEALEKNNSIKTRLISIISHDIITPLKFLSGAGKNLLEKRKLMSDELQQETISEITNTSQELQLLSTNILNWIKYQNENRLLAKEFFNVADLADQVFGILNLLAKRKQIQLVNEIDRGLRIYQYFEPLKILLYNLVTNAINFSEKGRVVVAQQSSADGIILQVIDEGVGMTPEQVHNIMADQFIISSANIDNKKGNGLGFLIIKDLLKMMDGSLQIRSQKGTGTIVSVLIPVSRADNGAPAA